MAVVVAIIALIVFKNNWVSYYPDNSYKNYIFIDRESKLDSLNEELRKAKHILEEVEIRKRAYRDGFNGLSAFFVGFFGVANTDEIGKVHKNQYYLVFSKLGLKIDESLGRTFLSYYTKDGQGYLSKTRIYKKGEEDHLDYVDKKVDYRYSSKENAILIPLNWANYKWFFIPLCILTVVGVLTFILILLRYFIQFLLAISNNNAFKKENVDRLRRIFIGLFAIGLIGYPINGLIYMVFGIFYPTDGVVLTYDFWKTDYLIIIFALVTYLIYLAFKKAMLAQEDHDLTI